MHFSVYLILSLLGFAVCVPTVKQEGPVELNVTRCVYTPDRNVINCHNVDGLVECGAERNLTGDLSTGVGILGIGGLTGVTTDVKSVKYVLYPKSSNNVTYSSTTGGIYLYYGKVGGELGIRVTNLNCFERLVSLLGVSVGKTLVKLENTKREVLLIGEVLSDIVTPKDTIQKRQYYWGGYYRPYYPYFYRPYYFPYRYY